MKHAKIFGLVAAATALCLATPSSGVAAPAEISPPLATGLAGPLQFDVGDHGQIYVGESFAGRLRRVSPAGKKVILVNDAPNEISGVASDGHDVAFTFTEAEPEPPETLLRRLSATRKASATALRVVPDIPDALLKLRRESGRVITLANLSDFETRKNPDGSRAYGFLHLSDECAAEVDASGAPVSGRPYAGIYESHPYAVANDLNGGWYVADAAANAILHVARGGRITVAAVLPAQKVTVTEGLADEIGLPDCTIGEKYAFEPVPTDVEVVPATGKLVVSLLPGGELPGTGAVYQVNPRTHQAVRLARGFSGATNVALGRGGRIFVAELFADRISVLRDGRIRTVVEEPGLMPAGVEFVRGTLYASTGVFGDGQIVTISR
jgi:hypothetical protein